MMKTTIMMLGVLACCGACTQEEKPYIEAEATVMYTGDMALDGCGWLIAINDEFFRPENLKEDFKVDDLEVYVHYTLSGGVYSCGMGNAGISRVSIEQIIMR
ncbi:hypothetical protein IFO69_00935 [Echinicola sp. CAU 1574]|uniref:Uncharacterized protein n=1 Tax=Echinicola arenosa TaxID=2774144 RepID=A0ABR9AF25_9BACT|nr:hypothetical protein [Echinicola arenosa]MBD8487301.1 hypothetical protein [Echinicola arenosa]